MLSIQQLIKLNREFRQSIISGLKSHKSGPNEGKFWPLFHLAIQTLRKHEALEILSERGFGQEAGVMLRSMFEAMVNAVWISKDIDYRIARYHAYQFFSAQKYQTLAEKQGTARKHSQQRSAEKLNKSIKQMAEEQGWSELPKWNFKGNQYWSGKTLKQMAEEIGFLSRYETIYKIYSDTTHVGAPSAADYFSQSESGEVTISNASQIHHTNLCLREGFYYLVLTITVLDECVNLGLERQLDLAETMLPEVFSSNTNAP